jgi:hypothetical protein
MQLDRMLERCRRLEERAAAVYRSYAAGARCEPEVCALWTALAREEEGHARLLDTARRRLDAPTGWRTRVDGWEEALGAAEDRLREAERVGPLATTPRQLAAALALEATELDAVRHVLLELADHPDQDAPGAHAERLAAAAERLSDDPDVVTHIALIRSHARLCQAS